MSCFTVLDLSPGEELEGEEPGRLQTDALEGHELSDDLDDRIGGILEPLALEVFDEPDALIELLAVGVFTQQTSMQLGWKG